MTVTVFDETETLAALDDHEIASALRAILEKEFAIHLGVELSARRVSEIALSWSGSGRRRSTMSSPRLGDRRVLTTLASGERPNLDKHGAPRVDPNTCSARTRRSS